MHRKQQLGQVVTFFENPVLGVNIANRVFGVNVENWMSEVILFENLLDTNSNRNKQADG